MPDLEVEGGQLAVARSHHVQPVEGLPHQDQVPLQCLSRSSELDELASLHAFVGCLALEGHIAAGVVVVALVDQIVEIRGRDDAALLDPLLSHDQAAEAGQLVVEFDYLAAVGEAADDMVSLWEARNRAPFPWAGAVREIRERGDPLTRADLAIGGNDLVELGVPASRAVGTILEELLAAVVDDPERNTREQLVAMVKDMRSER